MANTSFGWKNKQTKIAKSSELRSKSAFDEAVQIDAGAVDPEEVDWLHSVPVKKRKLQLEDVVSKVKRLNAEGVTLAENGRYWEAISKWDESLQLVASSEKVLEMKAQALMSLDELFPAVNAAKGATEVNPRWWIAWQTLGRALLNMGEIRAAIVSFQKALHINPANRDLWEEDLLWAVKLMKDLLEKNASMTKDELGFHVRECMRVGIT